MTAPPGRRGSTAEWIRALRSVAAYAAVATLGILLADAIVGRIVGPAIGPFSGRTIEGLLFVGVTAAVLYGVARAAERRPGASARRTEEDAALLRAVIDASPAGIVATDRERRIRLWSRKAADLFGIPSAEAEGRRVREVLRDKLPPVPTQSEARLDTVLSEGLLVELDGSTDAARSIAIRAAPIGSPGHLPDGHVFVATDVTATARAARDQLESRRRLEVLLANLPGMAYRCLADADRAVEFVSEGCRELLGHAPEDFTSGRVPYVSLIHAEDRDAVNREVEAAVAEGRMFQLTYRVVTAGGETRWMWERGRVVGTARDGTAILEGVVWDVTERRRLGEQLQAAHRLESLGRLSGGVAHDFNNLLTVILGHCEFLLAKHADDRELARDLGEIHKAGERAARLTRHLLAIGRRQILNPEPLDLNAVVRDMERLLLRLLGEGIELEVRIDPELDLTLVDPSQIDQILLNLAVNARDAMASGGRLTIETRNVERDEGYARLHPDVAPGRYAMLSVGDTGVGMDLETQVRIFEPFFTTKGPGKGTGLGLATVYGIVRQSHGHIQLYSEPGMGTTFKVYLPRASAADVAAVRAAVKAPTAPAPEATRGETILVVEDDAGLRGLFEEYLSAKGYRVVAAADGQEAITAARRCCGRIDLLATDIVLPGIDGIELARRVRALHPGARILVFSGYGEEELASRKALGEETVFLQKPFALRALAQRVRELIDEAGDPRS